MNFIFLELYRLNGRLLCYVRGFTQLPQKWKAATYFEGPGGHGRPLLAGSYVTQRVRLAYSKPGTSTGLFLIGEWPMEAVFVDGPKPKSGWHNKTTWRTSQTSFEEVWSGLGGDVIIRLLQC